ncbi:hypothetical protein MBLNU230_g0618t1 [Neophaeotheca triangularis]
MSTTPSPIQERTSKILQKTHQLVHNADLHISDRALAVDADTRFRLWAGNIGAYHPISDPRSADARLKDSPEVVNRLVEVLNELCEIQTEAQDIMNGARPDGSLVPDEQRPGAESSPNEDTTELHELLLSITDLLQSLFKISILIRKATHRDSSSPAVEVPSSSCMLCDEWDAKLRLEATSKGVPESHVLLIPIEKLRRHLAQHMEQLALFAIPPSVDSDVRSSECTSEGSRERKDELLADWHDGVVSEDGEGDESPGETKPIIPQEAPELVIPAAAGNSESDTSLWRPVYTQGPSDTPLPIVPLGDIPTLNEIYRRSQPGIPSVAHVRYGDVFSLVRADIATLEVDAIVHPTNFDLTGGPLSVYERAGPELLQECRTLKPIDAGDAVMTKAYGLPCKWVIHTRGPTYLPGESDRLRWLLQRCYRRSLDLALKMGCESLAFTAISTGLKRYPIEEAVDVAIDTITSWLNACSPKAKVFKKIVFCVHTKEDENAYISLLRRVQQDLDERSS